MSNIKNVVILAGGKGTRITEESQYKPKPLIEIGGIPILLHIMCLYSYYGYNNFFILAGHKSIEIKKYFLNDIYRKSDLSIDYTNKSVKFIDKIKNNWKVNIIDTGEETMTGGRLLLAKRYLNENSFFLTYGDCLSNVNLNELVKSHFKNKKIATVTGILQQSRFGSIGIDKLGKVKSFSEKPISSNTLINGGFFIFNKEIFKFLKNRQTILEQEPLFNLTKAKQLNCYHHKDFWHPMDNLREKNNLEKLWNTNKAPWKKYLKKLI